MSVFRVEKTKDYTVMSNYHFKEKEMSLKAKGLLSLMLSLPNDWDYTIAGLIAICKENETAIKSALNELKEFGYLTINKKMPNETDTGRIEYEYIIYEKPKQEGKKQGVENLGVEFQYVENQGQLNTNKLNTNNKDNNTIINNSISETSKKPKKQLTKKQLNAIECKKILEDFIKDEPEELKQALTDYVEVRKTRGLQAIQLETILKNFEERYKYSALDVALAQIKKATAGGWLMLVYDDKFKGTPKTSYSSKPSFDNLANENHNIKIYHMSDEEFEKLTHEQKINTLLNDFTAVADMTQKQQQFYNEYCVVHDWEN